MKGSPNGGPCHWRSCSIERCFDITMDWGILEGSWSPPPLLRTIVHCRRITSASVIPLRANHVGILTWMNFNFSSSLQLPNFNFNLNFSHFISSFEDRPA